MKPITLRELLVGQDLNPDKICDKVLNDTFKPEEDLVTGIIVKVHADNDMGADLDSMETDLNYYINQLKTARSQVILRKAGKLN